MSRRDALRLGLGAGVLLSVTACSRTAPPAAPTPAGPAPSPPPVAPVTGPPPDWTALRARLSDQQSNPLLQPYQPGYNEARISYNPIFDGRRPAAVARCSTPQDVQACVEFARTARIPVAARSGGHSYAGYSTTDGGLVVDLTGMATVRADGTRATVGPGARLIGVWEGLASTGRCLPAGTCPSVGIGGLTLGGGIGVLSRQLGLTCDRLRSAQVVTADARLVTASADSEPELFWALRGGGGGNFGVVTSFVFDTAPAPDLTLFGLRFPVGAAADVVAAWPGWMADAPDELWSNCVLGAGSPPTVRVDGCFVGSPAALDRQLARLPVATSRNGRFVKQWGHLDAMLQLAGCPTLTTGKCRSLSSAGDLPRERFVASSRMLPGPVADPTRLVALLDGRQGIDLLLDALGGSVSRVDAAATAFPHRSALGSVQIYAATAPGTEDRVRQAVAEVRDGLGRLVGGSGYVNYIDPTMPDWATAYYGNNLPRLRRVAARYDPDGVFRFAQAITPA